MKTKPLQPENIFNSAAVSPKLMEVLREHHDPFSGARLVCAELPAAYAPMAGLKTELGLQTGSIFMVGWIPSWRSRIVEGKFYQNKASAMRQFTARQKKSTPPDHSDFQRDWQRSRLYRWEASNTHQKNLKLDFNRMAMAANRIAQDFGMQPTKLRYIDPPPDPNIYGYYFYQDHRIELFDKRYSILIHELAHAIDYHVNGNQSEVYHGPSFLRTLLCLSHIYRGFELAKLEKTLAQDQLKIASLNDLPALKIRMDRILKSGSFQLKLP